MAFNISKCYSLDEKITKNFLNSPSKKTFLEDNDFSTKANILIKSTKDTNTVLRSSERNSNFIPSPNKIIDSDLASGEFDFKCKTDNNPSNGSKKTYRCGKCKEKSLNQISFNGHYKSHSAKSTIVCGDSQVISHEDKLERNKRKQTLEKEFACNRCEKKFTQNYILNRHYRIHTGERPFGCDVCKKTFNQKCHLTEHYRIHTNEKPFVCNICGIGFVQKNVLVTHYRKHTGEKPYECDVCKKRFNQKTNLNKHKRIHNNEMQLGCDLCEKRFKSRRSPILHRHKHKAENSECEKSK